MLRRNSSLALLALLGAAGLLTAACGGDDSATTTAAPAATDGPETTAGPDTTGAPDTTGGPDTTGDAEPPVSLALDAPVKIVGLISDPGGSDQNAVPDFNDGVRLAVDEINAAGGIGGQPIEYQAIETLPTGDTVINSLNLALEQQPVAILGPVSSTAILAIAERIDEAGVPTIHSTTEPNVARDADAGSPWIWSNRPSNSGAAAAAVRHAVEQLGAERIGVLFVNTSFGQAGAEAMRQEAERLGVEIAVERSFEFNATDLTVEVLAMSDVDVIIDWGTPATVGLAVNTLAQQGLSDIPHIGPGSVGFGFFASIVGDPNLLEGVRGIIDCNPVDDDRPEATAFVAAFTERFGYTPSYAAAEMYDTVYLLKDAIERAGSVDADAIREALDATEGFAGACSANYYHDNGGLNHSSVAIRFESGAPVTELLYEFG